MNETKFDKDQLIKEKQKRIYLCCAIIIISIIVIMQFVLLLYDSEELVKQFGFASTITSIILSVIAIFMTVVSGDSINSLLHKFRDLHDEISDAPIKIDSSITKMNDTSKKFEEVYDNLKETPQKIEESTLLMKEASIVINGSIEHLSRVMDEIKEHTSCLVTMKEELKAEIQEGFANTKPTSKTDSITSNGGVYKSILEHGSYWGNCLVYAAVIANEKNEILNLEVFCDKLQHDKEEHLDYFYAYMVMLIASTMIDVVKYGEYKYKIEMVNCKKEDVKNQILEYMKDNKVDEPFTKPNKDIDAIDNLFS